MNKQSNFLPRGYFYVIYHFTTYFCKHHMFALSDLETYLFHRTHTVLPIFKVSLFHTFYHRALETFFRLFQESCESFLVKPLQSSQQFLVVTHYLLQISMIILISWLAKLNPNLKESTLRIGILFFKYQIVLLFTLMVSAM